MIVTQRVTIGKTDFDFRINTDAARIVGYSRAVHTVDLDENGKPLVEEQAETAPEAPAS